MRYVAMFAVIMLPHGAWALTAADLYDEAPPPPPIASFSGSMLRDDTEVLTPQGIVDGAAFISPAPLPPPALAVQEEEPPVPFTGQTLGQIQPAAGPSKPIVTEQLAPPAPSARASN